MFSRRRLSLFVILMGTALAAPLITVGRNPISVQVVIGDNCVSGFGPARQEVIASLRTPDGDLRGRFRSVSDKFGLWGGCFELDEPSTFINGGDHLRIVAGSRSREISIPQLTPKIDRVSDTVQGTTRPHTSVDILIAHRASFRRTQYFSYTKKAGADGRFKIDTSGEFDLIGFDSVTVMADRGDDFFRATALAPGIQIAHGSNFVTGSANNGSRVILLLTDRNRRIKAEVTAGPVQFGLFELSMFKDDGRAAYPTGGDWLFGSFARDAALQMPVSTVNGSARNDRVIGRCTPDAPYMLIVRKRRFFGSTDSNGRLDRDLSFRINVQRGDQLSLYCMFPTGDVWQDVNIAL